MSIIVETGAIIANANSYSSVAAIDNYHDLRGREETWTNIEDELKEAAVVRATQALEDLYRDRWIGYKTANNTSVAQQLAWPRRASKTTGSTTALKDRDGIEIGINTIPQQLVNTLAEAAFLELSVTLNPSILDLNEQRVKREKIDVLDTEFFDVAPVLSSFPIIERMLSGLATPSTGGIEMRIGLTDEERDQSTSSLDEIILDTSYFKVL